MAMARKRPLQDPEQPYVYIWRLGGETLWVGMGKGNRGRPTCRACWNGRPEALRNILKEKCSLIDWKVIPCKDREEAAELERKLIAELNPIFNTSPHHGGWKGMHSAAGLERIAAAQRDRPVTDRQRQARRENARKLNVKRNNHASEVP